MKEALGLLIGARVLVTGAAGSIGAELTRVIADANVDVIGTDKHTMDVTSYGEVREVCRELRPSLIFHLAGAKHAPLGEEDPWEAASVNITGTGNVLDVAESVGARVVTASTCKACNPETAYGATKLIAERMTLNAGGSVARFYNVRESSGNVFEIWRLLPDQAPIPVTPCRRRFMSLDDAVRLLLWSALLPSGRYTVTPAPLEAMTDVATRLYPLRPQVEIPPRRGDRLEEPEMAVQESTILVSPTVGIARIASVHDVPVEMAVAA
jgi:FlaA1/EpsC-like NDP-sugar epimerase